MKRKKGKVIVAVSEGIAIRTGKYISEYGSDMAKEKRLLRPRTAWRGGQVLAAVLKKELKCKTRAIEFSLFFRDAPLTVHLQPMWKRHSQPVKRAVQFALEGATDRMVAYERTTDEDGDYKCNYVLVDLSEVANTEKERFPGNGLMKTVLV